MDFLWELQSIPIFKAEENKSENEKDNEGVTRLLMMNCKLTKRIPGVQISTELFSSLTTHNRILFSTMPRIDNIRLVSNNPENNEM